MGKIIAVANQKGGVGKTTTVINLSASLAEMRKKVLTIDLDPQGNTTSGLGIDKNALDNTVYDLLIGECGMKDCVTKCSMPEVDVIPSTVELAGAEVELAGVDGSQFLLKQKTGQELRKYDYVLIDCPPSLNILTINALTTAGSVLVPIQCEYYALEGLSQLMYTISLVRRSLNPDLKVEGVVFTMYDSRTNFSQQVVDNVRENYDQKIFRTVIPRNIRLAEAPSHGLPIILYDPRCSGAESYRQLAREFVKSGKKR